MTHYRATWAEIDLKAIEHNLAQIRSKLKPGCQIMAMVKANAYGHGMLQIAKCAIDNGAEWLAVATLDEAMQLVQNGIRAPILVLGYVAPEHASVVVENGLRVTVFTKEQARALGTAARVFNKPAFVHLKVDTGMGRIGVLADNRGLEEAVSIAEEEGLALEGVYTHLATADSADKTKAKKQIELFWRFVSALEAASSLVIPYKHLGNSAVILDMPEAHADIVRAGIILYGLYPSAEVDHNSLRLREAMRFLTRVAYIKEVPSGYGISYGHTFVTTRSTRVATLPVGYGDGYSRHLSNRGVVSIKGSLAPVIGRVCMDQIMVDVTDLPEVRPGDEVILFGRKEDGVTADTLANLADTINYEIVSMVSDRVPRHYIG